MCGLAGILSLEGPLSHGDHVRLRAAANALQHRGPDDEGFYRNDEIGLAFRRLSILDLAGGRQPMSNEDGTIQVVFNGEIYNYRELGETLRKKGHVFRTRSDTEVLVHLYEEKGDAFVHDLRGMFAIALWDGRQKKLLLIRDRLGIKPLFYHLGNQELTFASEIKGILAMGSVPSREMEPRSLAHFLTFLYLPGNRTFFKGITKLPPAHLLACGKGQVRVDRYWSLPPPAAKPVRRREDAVLHLRGLLEDSVRQRLMSDVPLGAFLSGGIDSSTVVAVMQRMVPEPTSTFTIGFQEEGYNEAPYAQRVAEALGTEHTALVVKQDAVDLLERVVSAFDEPFGDSSAIPTYLVSKLAREQVTVVLSGDGGDELFVGYNRYRSLELLDWARRFPATWRRTLASVLQRLGLGGFQATRAIAFLKRSLCGFPRDYLELFSHLRDPRVQGSIHAEWLRETDSVDWEVGDVDHGDSVDAAQRIDLQHYLPEDILAKVDRMSMACSLEARVPLLDHRLVEYVVSLPRSWKGERNRPKSLLMDACGVELPREVWDRRKHGFGIPLRLWFQKELREYVSDLLLDETASKREFWDRKGLEALISAHRRGVWDFSPQLWAFLTLELWHRKYLDNVEVPFELKVGNRSGFSAVGTEKAIS